MDIKQQTECAYEKLNQIKSLLRRFEASTRDDLHTLMNWTHNVLIPSEEEYLEGEISLSKIEEVRGRELELRKEFLELITPHLKSFEQEVYEAVLAWEREETIK